MRRPKYHTMPHSLQKDHTTSHSPLQRHHTAPYSPPQQLLPANVAEILAKDMRGVVTSGTGRRLAAIQPGIAGKTGTAELAAAPSHAWFIGFDPDITEAAALLQVNRVAQARSLDPNKVHALVEKYVQGRILWIFGEPYVNVLQLNMALDNGEAG